MKKVLSFLPSFILAGFFASITAGIYELPSSLLLLFFLSLYLYCFAYSRFVLKVTKYSKLLISLSIVYFVGLFGLVISSFKIPMIAVLLSMLLIFVNIELSGVNIKKGILVKYIYASILYGISKVIGVFHFLFDFIQAVNRKVIKNKVNRSYLLVIITAIVVGAPIVLLVVSLLGSANSQFQNIFNDIFQNLLPLPVEKYPWFYIFLGVLVLTLGDIFFLKYLNKFNKELNKVSFKIDPNVTKFIILTSSVILFSLNVIYIIFIFTELKYDFGNLRELVLTRSLPSYSRLATDRFWELTLVSFINLSIVYFLSKPLNEIKEKTKRSYFLIVNFLLTIFSTLFLCLSSSQRLSFYEQAYGFTPSRIISHSFVFVVAIIAITFATIVIKRNIVEKVNKLVMVLLLLWLTLVTILPLNYISDRVNIDLNNTHSIKVYDTNYFTSLANDSSMEYNNPERVLSLIYYFQFGKPNLGVRQEIGTYLIDLKGNLSLQPQKPYFMQTILEWFMNNGLKEVEKAMHT